jgi:hypothetical protein
MTFRASPRGSQPRALDMKNVALTLKTERELTVRRTLTGVGGRSLAITVGWIVGLPAEH